MSRNFQCDLQLFGGPYPSRHGRSPNGVLAETPRRCVHCGRVYYTDELVSHDGDDRSCPALLRQELDRFRDMFCGSDT